MFLLLICTCTYVRSIVPSLLDNRLGKVGYVPCSKSYVLNEYTLASIDINKLRLDSRVPFGNVLGSGNEKVRTWQ